MTSSLGFTNVKLHQTWILICIRGMLKPKTKPMLTIEEHAGLIVLLLFKAPSNVHNVIQLFLQVHLKDTLEIVELRPEHPETKICDLHPKAR